jgi:hypothetical protein
MERRDETAGLEEPSEAVLSLRGDIMGTKQRCPNAREIVEPKCLNISALGVDRGRWLVPAAHRIDAAWCTSAERGVCARARGGQAGKWAMASGVVKSSFKTS